MNLRPFVPLFSLILLLMSFFIPALVSGKVPVPADTIVGLYYPYRDHFAKNYPNGIPFKNFLITDPVRQQYPWKYTAINNQRAGEVPLWNPYTFAGTPLLANFQTGVFYPLNVLFAFLPFHLGWSIFILLQPVLGGVFLYLYLRHLKVSVIGSFFGGYIFAYSGFSIAWLEWGNIGHTALWLPLMLLSIDKVFSRKEHAIISNVKFPMSNSQFTVKSTVFWYLIFVLSLSSSFFAGYLQTFFYVFVVSGLYLLGRWYQHGRTIGTLIPFAISYVLFAILTFIQWYPTMQFITASARSIDQANWQEIEGWFLPWQHLIQFVAPDFFGNPTTLNYFGTWNYGELVGYVGMFPLLLAFTAMFFRHDKKTWFFSGVLLFSLLFALPSVISKLPFQFSLSFLSTSQPTRLMFLIDFSLSVLAAFGLDHFRRERKTLIIPLLFLITIVFLLWVLLRFMPGIISSNPVDITVAMNNLKLPTLLLIGITLITILFNLFRKQRLTSVFLIALLLLTAGDMARFAGKFTPFTDASYLYPQTEVLSFLQQNLGQYRYMTTDSRILPPNFSLMYGLQTVDGYDPLYLKQYAELIAASERDRPDITPPFGFNRIITPHRYDSPIIDLLGVKYVLSLSDLTSPKLRKVVHVGETRVYENIRVLPRVFFAEQVVSVPPGNDQAAINAVFAHQRELRRVAVVEGGGFARNVSSGSAEIITYTPNVVRIRTKNVGRGFLVLTDAFYPTWRAKLLHRNGIYIEELNVIKTDYQFRGVILPEGEYIVEFRNTLFSL